MHLVTQREFATLVGISNTHVARLIKQGKLNKGVVRVGDQDMIDAHTAAGEIGKTLPASFNGGEQGGELEKLAQESAKAKYLESILKAQSAEIDLQQKRKQLVERDRVYSRLFEFGQEMRQTLEAIPDRVIDDVLAANTRHEALYILKDAIRAALQTMADIQTRDITEDTNAGD